LKPFRAILAVAGVLSVALLLAGCFKEPTVELGPMPSESKMPALIDRRVASDLRAWVRYLKPEHAKILQEKGELVLTWEELKASYPSAAVKIDTFSDAKRHTMIASAIQKNKPISSRLAVHRYPDTVAIVKKEGYRVVLRSREGLQVITLQIAR